MNPYLALSTFPSISHAVVKKPDGLRKLDFRYMYVAFTGDMALKQQGG